MVGVGGAAHHTRSGASVRRDHLPHTPAHPAALEEASAVEKNQGKIYRYTIYYFIKNTKNFMKGYSNLRKIFVVLSQKYFSHFKSIYYLIQDKTM